MERANVLHEIRFFFRSLTSMLYNLIEHEIGIAYIVLNLFRLFSAMRFLCRCEMISKVNDMKVGGTTTKEYRILSGKSYSGTNIHTAHTATPYHM